MIVVKGERKNHFIWKNRKYQESRMFIFFHKKIFWIYLLCPLDPSGEDLNKVYSLPSLSFWQNKNNLQGIKIKIIHYNGTDTE